MSSRPGRRPGTSGTRQAILDAARASFNQNGYDRATIRDVAKRASVDPALVHHFFGSKQNLFAASMDLPFEPTPIIERVIQGDIDSLGDRMAQTFFAVWDAHAEGNPIVGLIRSATSNEKAGSMLREFITTEIVGRITKGLRLSSPQLRAGLIASQMIGAAFIRYVIRLEPIASMSAADLGRLIAPTLQRYLTADVK